ncbi:MAG: DNA (cytosine-5-)-methyltransferase [Chryseobacterium sp.]|nr:MAG: DNA (cytosine-5-)-methyltransferase [Chryseobacterium sp.]
MISQSHSQITKTSFTLKNQITFIDLFAGCGGLSLGFHKHRSFVNVLATDIWEQAKCTYETNFKGSKYIIADLSSVEGINSLLSKINSNVDLIVGGPPCKGFSTLNNSKQESKYNTLVDQYLTIVENKHPKLFVIENVRGITSKKHPSGLSYPEHIKKRISTFENGYNYSEVVMNMSQYGLAQNRIRYFFIASSINFDPQGRILQKILDEIENSKTEKKKVLAAFMIRSYI